MIPLTVAKIAEIVGGEIVGIDPTTIVNGDFFFGSRTIRSISRELVSMPAASKSSKLA